LVFDAGSAITGNFAVTINGAPTAGLGAAAGAVEFRNVATVAGLANTFTAGVTINSGARLNFTGNANTGDSLALGPGAKAITWNGGTLGVIVTSDPQNTNVKNFTIGAAGGTLDVFSGQTFTLNDAGQ